MFRGRTGNVKEPAGTLQPATPLSTLPALTGDVHNNNRQSLPIRVTPAALPFWMSQGKKTLLFGQRNGGIVHHRQLVTIIALAISPVACNDQKLSAPQVPDSREFARMDSIRLSSNFAIAAAPTGGSTTVELTLEGLDGFRITLTRRECASPTNTVLLVAPISTTLTTTACQEPIGRTWSFPGPYVIGTKISLQFISGVDHAKGAMFLTGAYPDWTIAFEDGFDADNNDFFLSITAVRDTCQVFANPAQVTDAVLLDPTFQMYLKNYWIRTGPNAAGGGVEYGGYLADNGGIKEFIDFTGNASPVPCQVNDALGHIQQVMASNNVVGMFHTHPYTPGAPITPNGSCLGIKVPGMFHGDGASDVDAELVGGAPFPSYIFDKNHVHRLKAYFNKDVDSVETFDRNLACPAI